MVAAAVAWLAIAPALLPAASVDAAGEERVAVLLVAAVDAAAVDDLDPVLAGARDAAEALGLDMEVRTGVAAGSLPEVLAADEERYAGIALIPGVAGLEGVDLDAPLAVLDRFDTGAAFPAGVVIRSDPAAAGAAAGGWLAARGARRVLCLVDESATGVLERRCDGARQALAPGSTLDTFYALDPAGDPSGITAAVAGRLAGEPAFDSVLVAREFVLPEVQAALRTLPAGRDLAVAVVGDRGTPAEGAAVVDLRPEAQGAALITALALTIAAGGGSPGGSPSELVVTPDDPIP